jgi:hypothetical protein
MARMSPLCSRNARPKKALVGRAQWGTHPGHPGTTYTSKLGRIIKDHLWLLVAALFGTRRVSARRGWAGEMSGLFEHPARGPMLNDEF